MEINLTIPEWFLWVAVVAMGISIGLRAANTYLEFRIRYWEKRARSP